MGGALFIGTPRGYNHFHQLVESAASLPDWKVFQFTTAEGGNVSSQELESASLYLDERTYLQEFEARSRIWASAEPIMPLIAHSMLAASGSTAVWAWRGRSTSI